MSKPDSMTAPLMTIRALVQQWRSLASRGLDGANRNEVNRCVAVRGCADELAAVLAALEQPQNQPVTSEAALLAASPSQTSSKP